MVDFKYKTRKFSVKIYKFKTTHLKFVKICEKIASYNQKSTIKILEFWGNPMI